MLVYTDLCTHIIYMGIPMFVNVLPPPIFFESRRIWVVIIKQISLNSVI